MDFVGNLGNLNPKFSHKLSLTIHINYSVALIPADRTVELPRMKTSREKPPAIKI